MAHCSTVVDMLETSPLWERVWHTVPTMVDKLETSPLWERVWRTVPAVVDMLQTSYLYRSGRDAQVLLWSTC